MFRAALATCFAAAAVTASAGGAQLSPLVGFVDEQLVRVDAKTLEPLAGSRIAAGSGGCASRQGGTACWSVPPWTISPDGDRLAIARNDASSLRLVDVGRMRVTADIRLGSSPVGALAWMAPGRVLALQDTGRERQQLLVVDLAGRRVVARRMLGGSVLELDRTAGELVMLLAPAERIGPARIAVAERRGAVRFARVSRILAGSKLLATGDHRVDSRLPGLAVDPRGRRAFLVGTSAVAEIDLRRLEVTYHGLQVRRPAARTKQAAGYFRQARWLGGGLLAVSGSDTESGVTRPAGLLVVDTRSWEVRSIDSRASFFVMAEGLMLTSAERGLAAYTADGEKRFELFESERAWVAAVHGGRAYVGFSDGNRPLQIVDLATGKVVGERRAAVPWLVQGVAAGWWG